MKRLVCIKPLELEYATADMPIITTGQSLIRIRRIGICGTDLHAFEGNQPFFSYPRILGHELSGELVDTGGAEGFEEGEIVTIIPYYSCGDCIACRKNKANCCTNIRVCGVHIDGGMVEYLSVPSFSLVHGHGLSFDQLALVEPLAIGCHGVRRADVNPGEFVLVIGAGPIGLGTMEFARIAGGKVIAMDTNEKRLDFCKNRLQVPHTINASSDNVLGQLKSITSGDMPDVIIDATGSVRAMNNAFEYMSHGGRYVLVGLQKGYLSFSHPEFHKREGTLMSSRNATRADFEHVIDNLIKGEIRPSTFITHRVGFDEVAKEFPKWLIPANGVIKAMVELN